MNHVPHISGEMLHRINGGHFIPAHISHEPKAKGLNRAVVMMACALLCFFPLYFAAQFLRGWA